MRLVREETLHVSFDNQALYDAIFIFYPNDNDI